MQILHILTGFTVLCSLRKSADGIPEYEIVQEKRNWDGALRSCAEKKMKLAMPKSRAEVDKMKQEIVAKKNQGR